MMKLKKIAVGSSVFVLSLVLIFLLSNFSGALAQPSATKPQPQLVLTSQEGHGGKFSWKMLRVSETKATGEEVSKANFNSSAWQAAIVPGTALNSLVNNKVFPEPYYGQNNMRAKRIIPDIFDAGRDFYHFWYRTNFKLSPDFKDKKVWLQFDGINYIADIWLNGKKVGNVKGMFFQKKFDVTAYVNINAENYLAVSVEPVESPGTMEPRNKVNAAPNENQNGGDGKIGTNVTMLMTAGWDFTFHDGIRDRNTGIWRDVKVFATGNVSLENPFVKSSLPMPALTPAREEISVDVTNNSNTLQKGILITQISDTKINIKKEITLQPGESKTVLLTANDHPELLIQNPKLWWPVNKGPQNLYTMTMKFDVNGVTSDELSKRFGIRDISSDRKSPDSSRVFYVNGKRFFVRGSNWIPEAMLRTSKQRTYAELRYTRQAGINFLRLWGGGISESDYFFDLCDELGFLVWHEFWMTGDTKPPMDTALYFDNVRSTIKRIRNHASLAYYVSSNEQDDILDIKPILSKLDGTRGYQFQSECCGVHDGSPYKYENPMQYYDNTASMRGSRIDGFCPEYGTVCLPPVETLREMMPAQDLWPINKETWRYLDGNGFHYMTTKYDTAIRQYGEPTSIEDYVKKGELVGSIGYRGIWENWNYNKFQYGDRFASGVFFWYHNSPVRQVCGRMWEWSLEPTAALYYAQDALEPLHAQYDFIKNTVSIYNDYLKEFKNLRVKFRLVDLNMNTVLEQEAKTNIEEDAVVNDILKINLPLEKLTPVYFIKLELYDDKNKLISDTFYWGSTSKYKGPWTVGGPLHGGFESLNTLAKVDLTPAIKKSVKNGRQYVEVKLTNGTKGLAFFTRVKLQRKKDQSLVRPAFYSDNYFSLLPGESKTITIDFDLTELKGDTFDTIVEGFNVKSKKIL
jgi:mannosylglycoprotein endo-beta-mannosidase